MRRIAVAGIPAGARNNQGRDQGGSDPPTHRVSVNEGVPLAACSPGLTQPTVPACGRAPSKVSLNYDNFIIDNVVIFFKARGGGGLGPIMG